jgi:hypothetical protein
MRTVGVLVIFIGVIACDGRSRKPIPDAPKKTPSETCAALPIRMGGSQGFVDCVVGEPSQLDYPECYTYWFDLVRGQEGVCPPTQLRLLVSGWPNVMDEYEVFLREDAETRITTLELAAQPGGQVGLRGPAPGQRGDILGHLKVVGGGFTEFKPSKVLRSYQSDTFLPRRDL